MTEPVSGHMKEVAKVFAEAMGNLDEVNATALIGNLMSANFRDYANTTNMLVESYQKRISDLEAEIAAIRSKVSELFASNYMPTESAIDQAVFYPARELIEQCRTRQAEM